MRYALFIVLLLSSFCPVYGQYNQEVSIQPILKTDTTSLGQKIRYPRNGQEEVTMLKITIPPRKSTGWHEHDNPVFAYVLQGTLTVEFVDQKIVQFPEQSSFSEVIHTPHRGINRGEKDLILLAIYLGEKGKPLSRKIVRP